MKRAVAFDVGSHTIGIAQSDLMRMFAHPVQTIRTQEEQWAEAIAQITTQLELTEIDTYIVGLPLTLKNNDSASSLRARRFYDMLATYLPTQYKADTAYKLVLFDERFSTKSAETMLISADMRRNKRKQVVDTVAAVIILDNYLAREKIKGKED
jgi:putative Holliday junction resolvase